MSFRNDSSNLSRFNALAPNRLRRRILRGTAGGLLLPVGYRSASAQSEGATRLLRLPKTALVIGNSKYEDAPLKNPANDARAIAAQLKQSGFEVSLQMDVAREPMTRAIEAYAALLAKTKAIGLFYFAGHGVQLAWRNFLLPVDAVIDKMEDIPRQCVDVGTLIAGITKAANAMNMVILDACRDNPFGNVRKIDQKGLSQLDAPPGTFLAYATSPGNVASDGDGANGLYTENLLRELKVPEAKIEDVFKRVRLGVRRRSNGQQIPWESTSLEEDFYFLPPKELHRLSEQEVQKLYEAESAIWENIKGSTVPAPLEDYLRRYPSGKFSELAQLQLDRVLAKQGEKKIRIESNAANPFSKGTGVLNQDYKIGDSYAYRVVDTLTRVERTQITDTVEKLTDGEIIYSSGLITDYAGNYRILRNRNRQSSNQYFPAEYAVGKRWESRSAVVMPNGLQGFNEMSCHITARESITVPAGTFNAFRIEYSGYSTWPTFRVSIERRTWMAPDRLRLPVVIEILQRRGNKITNADREELVSFKEG